MTHTNLQQQHAAATPIASVWRGARAWRRDAAWQAHRERYALGRFGGRARGHRGAAGRVGCGTAAAISASFNTPIAGVIFAMEVVMMEYTVAGFTPVILASVTAAILSQVFYGTDPAFFVPQLEMNSLFEVPFIIVCGIVTGLASVFFVRLLKVSINITQINIFYRITIAGIITAVVAYFFPEVMGVGYDTVNTSLLGGYSFGLLCAIAFAKIVVTAVSVGLGMPSGLIGPTLFIGATVGGALGLIANLIFPEVASSPGFYAMLGMGAMMGSVLQAPLSALMALSDAVAAAGDYTHYPQLNAPATPERVLAAVRRVMANEETAL